MNKKPSPPKIVLPPNRVPQLKKAVTAKTPNHHVPPNLHRQNQILVTVQAKKPPTVPRISPAAQLKPSPVRKPPTLPSRNVVQPAAGFGALVAAAAPVAPYIVGAGLVAAVGYQEVRINQPDDQQASYISDASWRTLTGGISRARYYWGGRSLVDALFQNFQNAGFRYHLMRGLIIQLVGKDLGGSDPEGNCFSYAKTFARVLNAVGIAAEPREVRSDDEGRFIVRVNQFIDRRVIGHIYYKDRLVPHYYMFNSHVAVWVPSLKMYYDPMACSKYASFNSNVIIDVIGDERHLRTRTPPPFARGVVDLEITNHVE